MPVAGGFFNKDYAQKMQNKHEEYNFINVGKDQFHAAAVSLMDTLQHFLPRANEVALKIILMNLNHYFPKYLHTQPCLTASERMSILLKSPRKSELVDCLSYVLRQLTVDELSLIFSPSITV